jgi:hypothetical protein
LLLPPYHPSTFHGDMLNFAAGMLLRPLLVPAGKPLQRQLTLLLMLLGVLRVLLLLLP